MKKNIFLLAIGLILAISAHAETTIEWTQAGCQSVGGTWITAHSPTDSGCDANHCNGMNFCRSSQSMHWFGAVIWCRSIGRELASLEDACPNGLSSSLSCQNLRGHLSGMLWTSTPSTTTGSYKILTDGHISQGMQPIREDSRTNTSQYALCK